MDDRKSPTLADWVVTALSPVLVMLMVGSLVFFLITVLYGERYSDRLIYTFFFFVAAAVLIARISIDRGSKLAAVYGLGLGLATFVAMLQFVEYPSAAMRALGPIINIGLMALVWWAANKLTWDCTHIDEAKKASGKGILAAAGLGGPAAENPAEAKEDADVLADEKKEAKKRRKDSPGFGGWLARYERYRAAKALRPHTPGVWVVYFALAAVPLFALGQALIPASDAARRRATFLQMAVYVGSALALLVTTSLLGLRKYLRERNASIPAAMTVGWLGVGGALILFFLAVGAVLPRPHSETPLFTIDRGGKADRAASKNAVVKDRAAGKGDGAAGKRNEAGDGNQNAKGGKQQGGNAGEKGDGGGKGDGKGGKEKDKDGNAGGPNKDGQGKQGDGNDDKKGEQDGGKDQGGDAGDAKQDAEDNSGEADGSPDSSDQPSKLGEALEKVGGFVKWLVWIVIAIAVIAGLIWFFLRGLAPFTDWAKNLLAWLRDLFKPKVRERKGVADDGGEEDVEVESTVPFSAFSDPFEDGSHRRKSPRELVEYSFAAMEAWAADRGEGRAPAETPEEFGRRLAAAHPELGEAARKLAATLVRCLYAPGDAPPDAVKAAKAFWQAVSGVPAVL